MNMANIWLSKVQKTSKYADEDLAIIYTKQYSASDDRSLTFESSGNSCNLVGRYSVH